MYDDVLVRTDGSRGADRGVDHALDLAASYGATVPVLHAVDERIHGTAPSSDELFVEELEEAGEEAVAAVAEPARERGLDVGDGRVRGVPHEAILECAREHDVVVMGRYGAGDHPTHTSGARPIESSGWQTCQ